MEEKDSKASSPEDQILFRHYWEDKQKGGVVITMDDGRRLSYDQFLAEAKVKELEATARRQREWHEKNKENK